MTVRRWSDVKKTDAQDLYKIQEIEAKIYKKYPNAVKLNQSTYGTITFNIPNIGDIENVSIFFDKKRSINHNGSIYYDVIVAQIFCIDPMDGMMVRYEGNPIMVYCAYPIQIFDYYHELEKQNANNLKYNFDLIVFKALKDVELQDDIKNKLTDGVKGLMLFS